MTDTNIADTANLSFKPKLDPKSQLLASKTDRGDVFTSLYNRGTEIELKRGQLTAERYQKHQNQPQIVDTTRFRENIIH